MCKCAYSTLSNKQKKPWGKKNNFLLASFKAESLKTRIRIRDPVYGHAIHPYPYTNVTDPEDWCLLKDWRSCRRRRAWSASPPHCQQAVQPGSSHPLPRIQWCIWGRDCLQHRYGRCQNPVVGVLDEPYSAKPAQQISPPGYIRWTRLQPM